jgi:hypothetical protein
MAHNQSVLAIESTEESIATWASRPYITKELHQQLLKANFLIVPNEGYGDRADLVYFPVGTEQLFGFLRGSTLEGLSVDICIEDEDYKEVALHADLMIVAGFVVTSLVAPLAVELIAEYIKDRAKRRQREIEVRSKLVVNDSTTGRSVKLSYEGPATEYRDVMVKALQELSEAKWLVSSALPASETVHGSKHKKRRRSGQRREKQGLKP